MLLLQFIWRSVVVNKQPRSVVVNKITNRKNAIKCLTRESQNLTNFQKKKLVEKLNKELDLLRMLNHPGVFKVLFS